MPIGTIWSNVGAIQVDGTNHTLPVVIIYPSRSAAQNFGTAPGPDYGAYVNTGADNATYPYKFATANISGGTNNKVSSLRITELVPRLQDNLWEGIGNDSIIYNNICRNGLVSVCPQSLLLCGQTPHFLAYRLRKCGFQGSLSIMCLHYGQTLIIIKDYKRQNHLTFELIPTWKEYIIYNGTKDEIKFNYSEGDLRLVNWKAETIKEIDIKTDKEIIEKHQWDTMGMYGELNEKLYLSYKYGKYIEPLKDLVLGNKLPIDYKIYFLICAGKITEDEWLKL